MSSSRHFTASVLGASALALIPSAALAVPVAPAPAADSALAEPQARTPARSDTVTAEPAMATMVEEGRAPTTTTSDAERYADLEAASPDAANFEGGSAGLYIGIGGGGIALVVLIVLLIVFL